MSFTDKFEKEDYYLSDEGFIIFTEVYHLKRGYCCHNNCKHCPWKNKITPPDQRENKNTGNKLTD